MIRPPVHGCCWDMIWMASRAHKNGPVTLVANTRSKSCSDTCSILAAVLLIPALLNNKSTRPKRSLIVSNNRLTSVSIVTSVGIQRQLFCIVVGGSDVNVVVVVVVVTSLVPHMACVSNKDESVRPTNTTT